MQEPIKKALKIAGIVLLAFFILYSGLLIVLGGIGKSAGNRISEQSVSGSMGMAQLGAPSREIAPMFSGEIAPDSAMPVRDMGIDTYAPASAADKKVIKTGSLDLKVERAETAAESIANIAKLNNGEISNSNFYESGKGIKSGYITVRVPYLNFDAAFEAIKKAATLVISESSNAQDVTEQFIDLEARLNNTKAEEASFVALLNRSGKIEEILAVTREVARVRGEIEQLEGQMRYLSTQTDMSTITVNISEDVEIAAASQDWRPWEVVKLSVKQLITGGQNLFNGLIAFLIVGLPMLLIYIFIIWLLYYIGKKVYYHFTNRQ